MYLLHGGYKNVFKIPLPTCTIGLRAEQAKFLYTRYLDIRCIPLFAREARVRAFTWPGGRVRARAKVSCIQAKFFRRSGILYKTIMTSFVYQSVFCGTHAINSHHYTILNLAQQW